jgi:hypothetical protein
MFPVGLPDVQKKKFHDSWGKCLRTGFHTSVEGKRDRWGVIPRICTSERIALAPSRGHVTGLRLVGECLLLFVLKDVSLGGVTLGSGAGSSDNVGHIPVWGVVRSLFPCGGKRT